MTEHRRKWWIRLGVVLLAGLSASAQGQTCRGAADMEPAMKTAMETAGRRYFDLAAHGDTSGLAQNSIGAVASSFGGIEAAVKENQGAFSNAQATIRSSHLLVAEGTEPLAKAEFLCGVFNKFGQTADSAVFVLNNLPPGKYGVVIMDVKGGDDARTLTLILQQAGTDWKMAGFYPRQTQLNGHDGAWFAQRARDLKAKGQTHSAWFYYRQAITLNTPADFVSTLTTDKLYDEAQSVQPGDLPQNGTTLDLTAGANTYKVTALFPVAVGKDFDLVVRYQAADVSNTYQTFQANTAVMKALLAKYPEFRETFDGLVARAVEPSGRDYGSMLPMKEIK